jgi:hypothetical protein
VINLKQLSQANWHGFRETEQFAESVGRKISLEILMTVALN